MRRFAGFALRPDWVLLTGARGRICLRCFSQSLNLVNVLARLPLWHRVDWHDLRVPPGIDLSTVPSLPLSRWAAMMRDAGIHLRCARHRPWPGAAIGAIRHWNTLGHIRLSS